MSKKFWAILVAVVVVAVATVAVVTEGQFLKGFFRLTPLSAKAVSGTKPLSAPVSGVKPLSIAKPGLNENITRAQLAVLLTDTLGTNLTFPASAKNPYLGCFKDIASLIAEPSICYLKSKDVMQGYADGTFKPATTVLRSEAAKIFTMSFLYKSTMSSSTPQQYKDVVKGTWYYDYVQAVAVSKIADIKGGMNASFFPGMTLSVGRAQYWVGNAKKNVPVANWLK